MGINDREKIMSMKRAWFVITLGLVFITRPTTFVRAESGPDPIFEKASPITMAELAKRPIHGVWAGEVSDYAPGLYKGELKPSPPHADQNPKKAIIVAWEKSPQRFVFSHETSYCPWMELPNGVGLCNQFFEGNMGWAELFNNLGRKERNSFVDIVQSGPDRAWVRWNYFCVNMNDDSRPALRGVEDYIAYPNGLVWRRLTYRSLMPDKVEGYSWQPIDFFALAPNGSEWRDLFAKSPQGDYCVGIIADAYSNKTYRKFWSDAGKPRREGDDELLWQIAKSKGFLMIMPFKNGWEFVVLGEAGGFPAAKSQVVDHDYRGTGGWNWGAVRWDHWPVGWLNSQTHDYKPGSPYPYHFGPFSHYLVPFRLTDGSQYDKACQDMTHNRWSARRVFYTLSGVGGDLPSLRRLARQWLDQGEQCADSTSVKELKP